MNNEQVKENLRNRLINKAIEDGWKYVAVKIVNHHSGLEGFAEGMDHKNFEKYMYNGYEIVELVENWEG